MKVSDIVSPVKSLTLISHDGSTICRAYPSNVGLLTDMIGSIALCDLDGNPVPYWEAHEQDALSIVTGNGRSTFTVQAIPAW